MSSESDHVDRRRQTGKGFETTHWSVVTAAAGATEQVRFQALEHLCTRYWGPIYSFLRCRGHSPHDAEDLTQGFIAHLLSRPLCAAADPSKGRFRTFILAALKNFVANAWDKARARKRGGDRVFIAIALDSAESTYVPQSGVPSADDAFDQRWAVSVLERTLETLRNQYAAASRLGHFEALQPCLTGDPTATSYAELGASLGMSEGAVKVAVHRLRKRYRDALRAEVASTLASVEDLEDELLALRRLVSRR